jgi:hypothetical protein
MVAELEHAGVPIERCLSDDQRSLAAVRLDPVRDFEHAGAAAVFDALHFDDSRETAGVPPTPPAAQPERAEPRRTGRRAGRLSALLAFAAVGGIAVLLISAVSPVATPPRRLPAHQVRAAPSASPSALPQQPQAVLPPPLPAPPSAPAPSPHRSSHPRSTQSSHPAPAPARPPGATALEATGHTLVSNGSYGAAIPVLEHAVQATGERTGGCVSPSSPSCLTYAYALYDLGRALRLSGDPAAAVPILESRMRIRDHRSIVAAELKLAREDARR